MKNLTSLALLAALASLSLPATAQFDTGAGRTGGGQSSTPWTEFKLDSKKTVQLNFRNANVDLVLDFFMKATGISIVKDPTLKEPMTVSSPKSVSLNQAFEILNAALGVRNYEMSKEGSILVIKKKQERGGGGGFDPSMLQGIMNNQQSSSELKYYKIKYAAASQVADTVNNVFAMEGQSSNPFAGFQFGGGGNQRGGGGRTAGRGGFNMSQLFGGGGSQSSVRAAADEYSNTLVVYAPRDKQRAVEDLIEQIDQVTDQPVKTQAYKLEFADATSLSQTLGTVLQNQPQIGRGANQARTSGNRQGGGGGGGFFGFIFGGQNNASTVAADTRTNSVIVTATDENQKLISELIKELDSEVPIQNNTFVIPLNNARADTVSQLLNSAFGSNGRTGNNGNTNRNNTNRNTNNNTNRNRNNGGGGGGGLGGSVIGNDLVLDMEDPMDTVDGELYTQVRTGQNFGFGQQNRNNGQQNNNLVRGQDGRLTNVPNLQGGVTIIPDPNTNSLIVVTDPANLDTINQILGQLDRIPQQVMIETIIVEVTLDQSKKLGVEWNFAQERAFGQNGVTGSAGTNFGVKPTTGTPSGFNYSLTGGNLTAFLNALQTDDKFKVLSTPRIFTSNNVQAQINISQSVPYVLSTREDNNGNLTFNYAFQDVGIVLDVTPQVSANGIVTLDVSQTANDLQGFTDFNAPIVNQRQAETTVSIKDGETIILGGIMRTTVNSKVSKIPILGDIPILGELFKSTSRQNQKTELMVFLTPHIVRTPEDAAKLVESEKEKLSPESKAALDGVIKKGDKQGQNGGIKSGPKQPGKDNSGKGN